jgi:hypothetical protein
LKALAAVFGFLPAVALDHRGLSAFEDEQALFEQGLEFGSAVRLDPWFTRQSHPVTRKKANGAANPAYGTGF